MSENTHLARSKFWKEHIDHWLADELEPSQEEYCRKHGLSTALFSKWKSKLYPKLRRTKRETNKSRTYDAMVRIWVGLEASQTDFCNMFKLDESIFSKRKNALYPKLKGNIHTRKRRNRYFENTRLSESQIEHLMKGFLKRKSASKISSETGISSKTCCKYLSLIASRFVKAAKIYPELFYGAGMLLYFGPTPEQRSKLIKAHKGDTEKISKERRQDLLLEALFYNSHFSWSDEEIHYFQFCGILFFFSKIYEPKQRMNKAFLEGHINYEKFDRIELTLKEWKSMLLFNDVHSMIDRLWEFCFKNNTSVLLDDFDWQALYIRHSYKDYKKYYSDMFRDLKWVMEYERWNSRSNYWDEYTVKPELVLKVHNEISDYYNSRK